MLPMLPPLLTALTATFLPWLATAPIGSSTTASMKERHVAISRRRFLSGAAGLTLGGRFGASIILGQPQQRATGAIQDLVFVNGRIHTMDAANRVVAQALIRNGRFAAV